MFNSRILMLAISVAGGLTVAAVLAVQRNERKLAAAQLQHDLQVWEDETGAFGGPGSQPVT